MEENTVLFRSTVTGIKDSMCFPDVGKLGIPWRLCLELHSLIENGFVNAKKSSEKDSRLLLDYFIKAN